MSSLVPVNWADVYRFKGYSWSEWKKYIDGDCYNVPENEKKEEDGPTSSAEFEPEDSEIYGDEPEFGEIDLVICSVCSNKFKPGALISHKRIRHENQRGFFPEVKPDLTLKSVNVEPLKEVEIRSGSDIHKLKELQFAKHEEPQPRNVDKSANEFSSSGLGKRQIEEINKAKDVPTKKSKLQPITGFFRTAKSEITSPIDSKAETKNSKLFPKLGVPDGVRPSLTVSISNATILSQLQVNGTAPNPPIGEAQIDAPSVIRRIKVLCPRRNGEFTAKENTQLLALKGSRRIKEPNTPFSSHCAEETLQLHPGYRRCKGSDVQFRTKIAKLPNSMMRGVL